MDSDKVIAMLSRLGHRITRQRSLVVAVVMDSSCLQCAEDIYAKCRVLDSSISFPTIYRTLDMLVGAEVVRKLHFGQGCSWFEPVRREGHHHHLVCRDCGAKVPVNSCPDELIQEVAQRNQFKVLDHQFEILGVCKGCQDKGPAEVGGRMPEVGGCKTEV